MGKLLLGALAGTVVLMIWGFLFWSVLPYGSLVMKGLPDGEAYASALAESVPETGVYQYPAFPADATEDEMGRFYAEHKRGPLVQIFYRAEGAPPGAAKVYLLGFLHFFASALLAAFLLRYSGAGLHGWGWRVLFVTLLGLFAGVAAELAKPIWWYNPWDFALYQVVYLVTGWLFAGLVLGKFVEPSPRLLAVREAAARRAPA